MKYVVVLGDGMADEPVKELNNKTPLQAANKPFMDELASKGKMGLVKTVPKQLKPGSDVANLSVLGYDPLKYYSGRSSLEAVSMGIELKEKDVSFRTNLVTLSDNEPYDQKIMIDHGAGDISSEEAEVLMNEVNKALHDDIINFYHGVSYRHLLVWHEGSTDVNLTPPHDILDRSIMKYLPKGDNSEKILELMKKSYEILNNHPINKERESKGLNKANSIWIWGEGTKPLLPSFGKKYNKKGAMISAVDLLKGIAMCGGLNVQYVKGATGNFNTDYQAKAEMAVKVLNQGYDFVYVHVEAPDECSHCGEIKNKVKSIELIDHNIVRVIKEKMDKLGEDYRMLILPDHPTPVKTRTHSSNPVPFILYDSRDCEVKNNVAYDEFSAEQFDCIKEGYKLMDNFIEGGEKLC